MENFGARLKRLRQQKKCTQLDVAQFIGVARGSYSQYEIGRRQPDLGTLQQLADFFQVSVDHLLGRNLVIRDKLLVYEKMLPENELAYSIQNDTMGTFRQRLISLRQSKQMTQKQLAKELKVSLPVIKKYESGASPPTVHGLVQIATYFNVTTDYLLGLVDYKLELHIMRDMSNIFQKIKKQPNNDKQK